MAKKQQLHSFNIGDDLYYTLKEIAALRGDANVAPLAKEIFEDYIRQHEGELLLNK